jgi:hypothetical protein
MRLCKRSNDVVHTLAADRPDEPLGKAVLPRRGGCNGLVPYAHGLQSTCDDGAKDAIPIADEVARSLIPGNDRSSPIIDWLRALARRAHKECGGRGVGAIGLCCALDAW